MPPVPLREENYEAKEETRSQHTSMVVTKRTVISANQLSIYGAVTDLCNEVSKDFRAPVKLAALDHLEKMKIPTDLSLLQKILPMHSNGRTSCKNTSENWNNCQKTRNYPNYVLMRV